MTRHIYRHQTSFGDCDPAGIVYYPNIYRWIDATFHDWIRQFGGHATLCDRLGSAGLGLMRADAKFRAPIRDGDLLSISITDLHWAARSLTVHYQAHVSDLLCVQAEEVRGVFVLDGGRMTAGSTDGLRALLDHDA